MGLTNLTKNALLDLGVACAMMAVLIVAASIFTVPAISPFWAPFQLATATMQKDELVIQLLKIVLGVVFAAYFVWWSLAVLSRLPLQ